MSIREVVKIDFSNLTFFWKVKAFIINHSKQKLKEKRQKMSAKTNIEPKTIQSELTDFSAHFSQVDNAFSHEHIQYLATYSHGTTLIICSNLKQFSDFQITNHFFDKKSNI